MGNNRSIFCVFFQIACFFLLIWFFIFTTATSISEIQSIFKSRVFLFRKLRKKLKLKQLIHLKFHVFLCFFLYAWFLSLSPLIKLCILMNVHRIIGSKFVGVIKWHEKGPHAYFVVFVVVAFFQNLIRVLIEWSYVGCIVHFEQISKKKSSNFEIGNDFQWKKKRKRHIHWSIVEWNENYILSLICPK